MIKKLKLRYINSANYHPLRRSDYHPLQSGLARIITLNANASTYYAADKIEVYNQIHNRYSISLLINTEKCVICIG